MEVETGRKRSRGEGRRIEGSGVKGGGQEVLEARFYSGIMCCCPGP